MRASTPNSGWPTVVRSSALPSSSRTPASDDLMCPLEATGDVSVMPQAWVIGRPTWVR